MRKSLLFLIRHPLKSAKLIINLSGNRRGCNACGRSFNHFAPYKGGAKMQSDFLKTVGFVGSDLDNFGCMYCGTTDRERHLIMFFDALGLWEKLNGMTLLHFAPEKGLAERIKKTHLSRYTMADLRPAGNDIERIDITEIPYGENTFDFIICNHVLEHVKNYRKALEELYRVMKPGGTAILQTPYSKFFNRHFQEQSINSDEMRRFFYGEADHQILFSQKELFHDFEDAGFELKIIESRTLFDMGKTRFYGVNHDEALMMVIKPL